MDKLIGRSVFPDVKVPVTPRLSASLIAIRGRLFADPLKGDENIKISEESVGRHSFEVLCETMAPPGDFIHYVVKVYSHTVFTPRN